MTNDPTSLSETIAELERLGTEQNRTIYRRHGAGENVFGVSFANLNALKKRIRRDHALALALWETGNVDARALATMVADPQRMDPADIRRWVREVRYYVLADLVARHVAALSPHARALADEWTRSEDEWEGDAGWTTLSLIAMDRAARGVGYDDDELLARLAEIERRIAGAPNRTRHAMNGALIAIGLRNERLRDAALAAADRIGRVVVDHGETGCRTPAARPYIEKGWARRS